MLAKMAEAGERAGSGGIGGGGGPPVGFVWPVTLQGHLRVLRAVREPAILILIFRVVGGAGEAILVRQVESGNGLRIELWADLQIVYGPSDCLVVARQCFVWVRHPAGCSQGVRPD